MDTKNEMANVIKVQLRSKKGAILLVALLFTVASVAAGSLYIHRLQTIFLDNVQFYLDEIAGHDKKSVEQEIEKQWERLKVVGKKLALEGFQNEEELQHFLNLEMEATGFEKLMLLDERGYGYEANYLIRNMSNQEWVSSFLEQKEPFVLQNQMRLQFIVRDNSLLCGVPIEPIKIGDTSFTGIIGSYRMATIKESLQVRFFDEMGMAQVVGRDGTIITTEITQRGETLENLLEQLKGGHMESGDSYERIAEKLSRGEVFRSVYTYGGNTMILTAQPLDIADWMVVVTVPLSIASSQTTLFLRITAFALLALCLVIAAVLTFAFISYKRTMILKNSEQIFYRERLFNLLAMHTDDVFAIVNPNTDAVYFISENAKRILGVAPGPDAKVDLSIFSEEIQDSLQKDVDILLHSRSVTGMEHERVETEFEWNMPKGGRKWIHVAIYTAETKISHNPENCLIVVLSDYTQIKENQRKLENAIEQAQEAAWSKSMFLSNMSHEMRTPLNGIIGCLKLMQSHLDEPAALRGYLQKAEYTSRYLVSLVSEILDMSKIENHMMKIDEQELSLRDICSNTETMFHSRMDEKGIWFLVDLREPLWVVRGDEVRIQQVLTNLLSNALKFTDQGGTVSLTIRQELIQKYTVKTIFVVSDTGIGMSQEFLKQIWKPFEQERLDNARLHGGTGLGMAITHELVELMGGTVVVTSELRKGSTFIVELIQEALRCDDVLRAESLPYSDEDDDKNLEGRTLLVAEDNELNREILVTLLKDQEACVLIAGNGAEAVKVFTQSSVGAIDAILMDMQMPVMDGCEAARRIRELDRADSGSVIIVACTANAFQEDVDRAKQSGMNGHITKPLDMAKLSTLLKKLWKKENL